MRAADPHLKANGSEHLKTETVSFSIHFIY